MWLFTKYGFFSAVCAWQGDGSSWQPADPDRIMVRARLKSHLEALIARFPDLLGGCEVRSTKGSDYPHRIIVAKPTWVGVVAELVQETDYDNFKGEVLRCEGKTDYEKALHKVWSVMRLPDEN